MGGEGGREANMGMTEKREQRAPSPRCPTLVIQKVNLLIIVPDDDWTAGTHWATYDGLGGTLCISPSYFLLAPD